MDQKSKTALLIDYDNFSKEDFFPILLCELEEYGDVILMYGFYSNLNDSTIAQKFTKLGIEAKSQIAYSTGKNATDIRMTIEAMLLIEKEYIDTICIASNDSDFTPLVMELKKHNKRVIGAGDNQAKENYKNAFNEFISVQKITDGNSSPNDGVSLNNLIEEINAIIKGNHDDKGFADFSNVIQTLKNKQKDFSPKNFGAKNKQALPFFKEKLGKYYEIVEKSNCHFIKIKGSRD